MKSSQSIWHILNSVKSTVKILSIFVAFLENTNFNYRLRLEFQGEHSQGSGLTMCICRLRLEFKVAHSNWNVVGYYVYSADLKGGSRKEIISIRKKSYGYFWSYNSKLNLLCNLPLPIFVNWVCFELFPFFYFLVITFSLNVRCRH